MSKTSYEDKKSKTLISARITDEQKEKVKQLPKKHLRQQMERVYQELIFVPFYQFYGLVIIQGLHKVNNKTKKTV